MKALVTYMPQPDKVELREVVEYDSLGINPNGHFCFIKMTPTPPYGPEWTPIEGALVLSLPFESVKRIEAI